MNELFIIERIKDICNQRQISSYGLSKICDVPHTTIHNIIHNKNIPSLPTLIRICDGLNITISQFFREDISYEMLSEEELELLNLWNNLNFFDKELVKAYIYGLSHKKIEFKKEQNNDI